MHQLLINYVEKKTLLFKISLIHILNNAQWIWNKYDRKLHFKWNIFINKSFTTTKTSSIIKATNRNISGQGDSRFNVIRYPITCKRIHNHHSPNERTRVKDWTETCSRSCLMFSFVLHSQNPLHNTVKKHIVTSDFPRLQWKLRWFDRQREKKKKIQCFYSG